MGSALYYGDVNGRPAESGAEAAGVAGPRGRSPAQAARRIRSLTDDWDERLGVRLDRELICEMIIRYVLSEILVPEAAGRRLFPVRVNKLLGALIMGSTSRTRR